MPPNRQFGSGPRSGTIAAMLALAGAFESVTAIPPVVGFSHNRSSLPSRSRSPIGDTSTATFARLSAGLASDSLDATAAASASAPTRPGRRTIVSVVAPPGGRLGAVHTSALAGVVHALGGCVDTTVVPGGSDCAY